ncbi:unnamed protein product, partial [Mesorhabditis spiculigera]
MQPTEVRRQLSYKDTKEFFNIILTSDVYYYGAVFSNPGPDGIEKYNWIMIVGTVAALSVISGLYWTTCITGMKLYFYVKRRTISRTVQKYQVQLLLLLLAQAVSPFIFEFVPVFIVLVGGTTRLVPHYGGICAPLFFGGYSGCDAILALLLFKAYRRRMLEICRFKLCPRHRSKIFQTATEDSKPASGPKKSATISP